jgi:hypothetical protein
MRHVPQESSRKLRDLAAWYREYAERAGNSAIWDARLRTAEELEKEADLLDQQYKTRFVSRVGSADSGSGERREDTGTEAKGMC